MAVMKIKLFGDLVDVAPLFTPSSAIAIVNQGQVQFSILFGAKEFPLVAQVSKKLTVAGNVSVEPSQLPDQCAFSLFIFWIESQDLSVKQIVEVQRSQASAVFRCSTIGVKPASPLSLLARHIGPTDLLGVDENARLDGFMFSGRGH